MATLRSLPPIDRPLEDGWTLPARWYGDEAVYEAECASIFARTWQYAGRSELVDRPGSFFATEAGHGRVREITDSFFGPDASQTQIEELIAFGSQVALEDMDLVRSVQAGLDTGTVPQGRLMAESERLIADFQRRVRDALLGGVVDTGS